MDQNKQYNEPWEDGVYGIGNTQPPKNHGGLIALLLIVVIFLSGIVTTLGIMNVQLFKELEQLSEAVDPVPMSFSEDPDSAVIPEPTELDQDMVAIHAGDGASITLTPTPDGVENIPQEGGLSWQEIYEKNMPAVVSITTETLHTCVTGTGVIISDRGYIVTNAHVVEDAMSIHVLLSDDRTFAAHAVGLDPISDLAVLHIEATGLTTAEFGDSNALRVGDAVAAIGDPLGSALRGTMTNGIVSAINRDVQLKGRTMTLIQTNAALNAGNSGGPLVNCYGQVVGINTMKISSFSGESNVEGLGFAIPSATAKDIIDQLVRQGYVSGRPTLGVTGESISRFEQYYYRWPAGLVLTHIFEDSDAFRQGLESGDILVSINDQPIINQDTLDAALYPMNPGDTVTVVIYRDGTHYQLTLTLGEARG